ncbi:MAG: dephospho-CoA kinase [Bacteroidaceae bacterium]|nr:dephospho-CoA kinase [Bacteroidaceae bacterium]
MKRIAITGGIGSGKSTLCRLLEARGVPVFYCDREAKRLMVTDPALQAEIVALLSLPQPPSVPSLPEPPSVPSLPEPPSVSSLPEPPASFKDALRVYISQGPEYADRINRLVWPRVATAWEQFCQTYATLEPATETVVMECALLFESGFDALVDTTVLVTAPTSLRLQRVAQRDGITPQQVSAIIALQLPGADKARRATHILPNDSTPADLLAAYQSLTLKTLNP